MTVSAQTTRVNYTANGILTTWDYTFPIILSSDVLLYVTDTSGVMTLITANYSVDVTLSRVTYPTAISGLSPVTTGYTVSLVRKEPLTQNLSLTSGGAFNAADVEQALDKITMKCQELQADLDRCPKQSLAVTPTDLILPTPVNGMYLGWSGGLLVNLAAGSFGAGTLGAQAANAVAITGGSITGITNLAIADGGTGASTQQAAIDLLTDVAGKTAGYVLTVVGGHAAWAVAASTGGLWTNVTTTDYLTQPTHKLVVGNTSALASTFVSIDGNADLKQLVIQGHTTQTNTILEVQKSDGTVAFSVSNTAGIIVGGTTSQIKDGNANELIIFSPTAAAVNETTMKNNSTGLNPRISASGETNVGLELSGKGTRGIIHVNASWRRTIALTDGATPALDASLGDFFYLDAAGNRTVGVPSNPPSAGYTQTIMLIHYANGGARTLALNTAAGGWRFNGDITGLTATASGKKDYILGKWNETDSFWDVIGYTKGA